MLLDSKKSPVRSGSVAVFVASAAVAAAALRFAWHRPLIAAGLLGALLLVVGWRLLARRRLQRAIAAKGAAGVEAWGSSLAELPHGATVAPLLQATAFTAYGRVAKARAALDNAERGPVWEEALEHRLFLDALLFAFEGDAESAMDRAARLAGMPLPPSGEALRDRALTLRQAVSALVRAFCHRSSPGDRALLEAASKVSPLVFWAMRYAAAIAAIDEGDAVHARELLATAPDWPTESAFRRVHDEITRVASAAT